MFQGIRDLAAAILNLADSCSLASGRTEGAMLRVAAVEVRLAALESSLAVKLAEAEALAIAAAADKKVARNAENRTHTLEAKRLAKEQDFFGDDEDSEDGSEARNRELQDLDAEANGIDVRTLHQGLEVPRRLTRGEQAYLRMSEAGLV